MWFTQRIDPQCQYIDCPSYDPIKDYRPDPSGHYVLIRPNFEKHAIEVAICTKDHRIIAIFTGAKAQDVYDGIFRYQQKHQHRWFDDLGHAAYLGKELKKVELVLASVQNSYFQE